MAKRTKEEAEQTRQDILDAAIVVFLRNGVTRATLQEIATEAGLTRGAIYHHFDNKGEILAALIESVEMPDEIMEAFFEKKGEMDPLEALKVWCERALEVLLSNERANDIYRIFFHRCEIHGDIETALAEEGERSNRVHQMIRRQFQQAQELGILREDITPDQATYAFTSLTKGMYIRSLWCPILPMEAVPYAVSIDAFLKGLRKR